MADDRVTWNRGVRTALFFVPCTPHVLVAARQQVTPPAILIQLGVGGFGAWGVEQVISHLSWQA